MLHKKLRNALVKKAKALSGPASNVNAILIREKQSF